MKTIGLPPPPAQRFDGERCGVAVATYRHPTGVGCQVVDAVRDRLGHRRVGEVVDPDPDRFAAGLPVLAIVLVSRGFADQLLFLGVDADHRVTGLKVAAHRVVDVRELAVTVGMLVALGGLGVGLQAVPGPVQ